MMGVFVIGVGRSGTSVATRLLEIAGAHVGTEETLLSANKWNEGGFWEDKRVTSLNTRLLEAFGGSYLDPPILGEGWLADERVKPFRAEAEALLAKEFFPHALWAVKDPRVTVVLPFWQSLAGNPHHLVCVRNPLDAASSLTQRDGMPLPYSIALWHLYTLYALVHTTRASRTVLMYEDVVCDPLTAIRPLYRAIGVEDRLSDPSVRELVGQSVRSGLKHHDHTLEDLSADPYILDSTKALYRAIVERDDSALDRAAANAGDLLSTLHVIVHSCAEMFQLYCDATGSRRAKSRRRPAESAATQPGRILGAAAGWIARIHPREQTSER